MSTSIPHPLRLTKGLLNMGSVLVSWLEFKRQSLRMNERPIEYGFVFRHLATLYPHKVLDVGSGTTALPQLMRHCGLLVTAIDNVRDYWPAGTVNRHYWVVDDDITRSRLTETFDLVTCISVLEHIQASDSAIANIFRLLKPGGHLILTCPYTDQRYIPNVYRLPESTRGRNARYVCQSFSRTQLEGWLTGQGALLRDAEFWQCWEGEYWTAGERLFPPRKVSREEKHHLACLLMQKQGP